MEDALSLGASGRFVRVYLEGDPLRVRILERAKGEGPQAEEAARVLLAWRRTGAGDHTALTPTQTEVLRRVQTGASNKAVARDMGVSLTTVKTHLRAIFQRLEVSSRTHAVARGRELGLL